MDYERDYSGKDVRLLLKLPPAATIPGKTTTNFLEFQEWFAAGLRTCEEHEYPFIWCIIEGLTCPKCLRIADEIRKSAEDCD